jgi:hypothetical protein
VDADHRKIAVRVVADQVRIGAEAIGQRYVNLVGVMYNVAICQNEPVGGEHETRSAARRMALMRRTWILASLHPLLYFDIHHGRADSVGRMNNGS